MITHTQYNTKLEAFGEAEKTIIEVPVKLIVNNTEEDLSIIYLYGQKLSSPRKIMIGDYLEYKTHWFRVENGGFSIVFDKLSKNLKECLQTYFKKERILVSDLMNLNWVQFEVVVGKSSLVSIELKYFLKAIGLLDLNEEDF